MNLPDNNSQLEEFKVFADIDYIITDLDGTFIQHGENVWEQLQRIQAKFQNSRPTVTIATGRTYYGTKRIAEIIRIKKDTPIILYNGAVIISYITQTIRYLKTIPSSVLYDLCGIIDLETQSILAYYLQPDKNKTILESVLGFGRRTSDYDVNGMKIIWLDANKLQNGALSMYALINGVYDNAEMSLFQYEPCSILIDKKAAADNLEKLSRYLNSSELVSCTDSGSGYYEVRAQGVQKGTILDIIKKYENKKCAAIGDNDNDAELLQRADIGIAVANASPVAINAAQYQCSQPGTNGVLELVEVIKAANR